MSSGICELITPDQNKVPNSIKNNLKAVEELRMIICSGKLLFFSLSYCSSRYYPSYQAMPHKESFSDSFQHRLDLFCRAERGRDGI